MITCLVHVAILLTTLMHLVHTRLGIFLCEGDIKLSYSEPTWHVFFPQGTIPSVHLYTIPSQYIIHNITAMAPGLVYDG